MTGRPTPTFLVLAAGALSFAMLQSLIAPVLPTIQTELQTTQEAVTWVMTANLLSAAIFTPILGRVGDLAGKKGTYVAVLAVLAAGCLLAAFATDLRTLVAARVIQGAAGAVFPLAYGIIRDEFPAARVPAAVGAVSAVIAAGGGIGIVLAGPIVASLGLTWLFIIPAIVVIVAAVAGHLVISAYPPTRPGRINWLAAALLAGGLLCLLLATSKGAGWGWASAQTVTLVVTAAVLVGAWVRTEARSTQPLVDMRIMRLPTVWTTNLVALLFGAGWFAVFAFLPQFVQVPSTAGYGFGADVTEAGLLMLPMVVTMSAAGVISGRVVRWFGSKAQLVTASVLSALATATLALAHQQIWQISFATAMFGLAAGLAFSAMANLIVGNVPAAHTGVASGMNANFRTIGGSIGAALMGAVVTSGVQSTGLPTEAAYVSGFLVLTATSVAAAAAAVLVPGTRRPPRADAPADGLAAPRTPEPAPRS
ncbi:MFS transporter [Micromonospora sp. WMMD812]|uniref:MFS transporter n=1 Tax=Micromonospora sp. WMMD812 TaxID=3015152 RepID=UPI00248C7B59|nr:MFS transporter [Micromonospora sp. WMMD812]WBB70066.1 MFS transporter [Micromonospora sp. WMMD812]